MVAQLKSSLELHLMQCLKSGVRDVAKAEAEVNTLEGSHTLTLSIPSQSLTAVIDDAKHTAELKPLKGGHILCRPCTG